MSRDMFLEPACCRCTWPEKAERYYLPFCILHFRAFICRCSGLERLEPQLQYLKLQIFIGIAQITFLYWISTYSFVDKVRHNC